MYDEDARCALAKKKKRKEKNRVPEGANILHLSSN